MEAFCLYARYLKENAALARAVVEVDQNELLPGPENQSPAGDGDGHRRSQEGGPNMGVTVSVTPAGIVAVWYTGRSQSFQGIHEVPDNTAFIFDGGDAAVEPGTEMRAWPSLIPASRTLAATSSVMSMMSVPADVEYVKGWL